MNFFYVLLFMGSRTKFLSIKCLFICCFFFLERKKNQVPIIWITSKCWRQKNMIWISQLNCNKNKHVNVTKRIWIWKEPSTTNICNFSELNSNDISFCFFFSLILENKKTERALSLSLSLCLHLNFSNKMCTRQNNLFFCVRVKLNVNIWLNHNLGPQSQGLNATRIGNRNGLDASAKPIAKPKPKPNPKPKPIPKPREICPRFPASMKMHTYNGIRNRNSNGTGLGADVKTNNVTPTKRLAIPSAIPHSNVSRTSSQTTSNSATSSNRSLNSARNRPQTAKSNPKPTAV